MVRERLTATAVALEAVGIAAITGGLVVECLMQADIGFICITGGSGIVALGGFIWVKLRRKKQNPKE